jgi:inorganic pyrophosphatase
MKTVKAIIETPKGSSQKYDYDPENKWFELKKIMPAGMVFPFDFGFIPKTMGEDGDPLDIIIISEFHSFPGCAVSCRIIGAITAQQTEDGKTIRNDRFLAVPECSETYNKVKSLEDLPKGIVEQIEKFFMNYNEMADKKFKPLKKIESAKALKLLKQNGHSLEK